jgi:hypothetical protein
MTKTDEASKPSICKNIENQENSKRSFRVLSLIYFLKEQQKFSLFVSVFFHFNVWIVSSIITKLGMDFMPFATTATSYVLIHNRVYLNNERPFELEAALATLNIVR